jgi:hypothetical protein
LATGRSGNVEMNIAIQDGNTASEVELARQHAVEVGALIDSALVSLSTGFWQLQSAEKGRLGR